MIYNQSQTIIHFKKLSNKNILKIYENNLDILKAEVNEINLTKLLSKNNSTVEIPF